MARRTVVFALLAAALAAPAARADGDPASDVLLSIDVFIPYQADLAPGSAAVLTKTVREAKQRGYKIRVAVIPRRFDLGLVTPLWLKPQRYAQFLAQELSYVYKGRLLVVMPNGYGTYWCVAGGTSECAHGKPLAVERRVLARLPSARTSGKDVAAAAAVAVRKLAAAHGVTLVPVAAPKQPGAHDETGDRLRIGAVFVTALVLGGAIWLLLRYRRRRA